MKKLGLIIMSSMLLLHTVFFYAAPADAAYSKVATATAKKVAKEVVENNAVQMAMDIVFNYEMTDIMKNGYKTDSGYTAVCMEKQGDKCTKAMQAKVPTTAAEKKTLADKVEQVLERKTGTAGWGKYLDWIVPIFLLGGAAAWIESKFDSDSKGLFDDIAKESLDETGFIKPIQTTFPTGEDMLDSEGNPLPEPIKVVHDGTSVVPVTSEPTVIEFDVSNRVAGSYTLNLNGTIPFYNSAIVLEFQSDKTGKWVTSWSISNDDGYSLSYAENNSSLNTVLYFWSNYYNRLDFTRSTPNNIRINNEPWSYPSGVSWSYLSALKNQNSPTRIILGGYRYSGVHGMQARIDTSSGDYATFNGAQGDNITGLVDLGSVWFDHVNTIGFTMKGRLSIYPNMSNVTLVPYKPNLKEYPQLTIDNSSLGTDDGSIKIPSPTVVPIKTPEGVPVKPDGDGGWEQLDGTPIDVDEDALIVEDIQKTPEGDGIITPDGNEVPLPKPDDAPPATDGESQENEFVCQRDLKDIDFKAVSSSFTTSFPFSIPWDIKRFVDNALGTIGEGKKPEIELAFLGDGVVLTMPDMIDNWMPFLRNVVIIMFDISLVYLFFRWTKGGGD